MTELRYTLFSEGSTDRALLPILSGILREYLQDWVIDAQWADLQRLPKNPAMSDKIERTLQQFPCDLLFVHRDADNKKRLDRVGEIRAALEKAAKPSNDVPAICVIPVRMTETWLMIDELAIRKAVGRPNGKEQLNIPRIAKLEAFAKPKEHLTQMIRVASGFKGRRLEKLNIPEIMLLIAEHINDYSILRKLPAFNEMDEELRQLIKEQGWGVQ